MLRCGQVRAKRALVEKVNELIVYQKLFKDAEGTFKSFIIIVFIQVLSWIHVHIDESHPRTPLMTITLALILI